MDMASLKASSRQQQEQEEEQQHSDNFLLNNSSNGSSSRRHYLLLVNLYCFGSALFFLLCAYAQMNDPDPEIWIAGYVTGGALLNILVAISINNNKKKKNEKNKETTTRTLWPMIIINAFAAINAGFLFYWIVDLLPQLDYSLLPSLKDFAWSILEFEEGREIGGLLILLLHVLQLRGFILTTVNRPPHQTGAGNNTTTNISTTNNLWGTSIVVAIIGIAIYLWIAYQPEMNIKHYKEYCSGVFRQGGVFNNNNQSS